MSFRSIAVETDLAGILTVTVNRPEKRNALSMETIAELDAAFERAAADPAVRALIVTGAGDQAFAAGADIAELARLTPPEARAYAARGQRVLRRLETMGKPSVAAINGAALGGGLELALACTARIAADDALLGLPEVRLGLTPGYGGTQRLPRLVGRGRALQMLLWGEPVQAAEALAMGLVNAVASRSLLLEVCRQWLDKVLSGAPLAVALVMEAVDRGCETGLEEGLKIEAAAFALAAATEDRNEGTAAFLAKRRPVFTGK